VGDGDVSRGDGWRVRTARLVTELLAPAVLVGSLLVLLSWRFHGYRPRGLALGGVAALFESVIPFAYILRGVSRGQLSDRHVRVREQRRGPLLFGLGSVLVGFAVLLALGAARPLLAAVVAGGVGLVVAATVSHWWKMSIHAAVAAGACVILTQVYGPAALAALPLVGLVGWSRVVLRDHTVTQVLVGAAVGAAVAGTVFGLLR
jgi:hypothetical protein